MVCRKRIEHPRLGINLDRPVTGVIPSWITRFFQDESTGSIVCLAAVVTPMATHLKNRRNGEDGYQRSNNEGWRFLVAFETLQNTDTEFTVRQPEPTCPVKTDLLGRSDCILLLALLVKEIRASFVDSGC